MPHRCVVPLLTLVIFVFLLTARSLPAGAKCSPLTPELNKLKSVEQNLEVCQKRLDRAFSALSDSGASSSAVVRFVNQINSVANTYEALDHRTTQVMDRVADTHLQSPSDSMRPVSEAFGEVQTKTLAIIQAIDHYLRDYPDITPPEARDALQSLSEKIRNSIAAVGPAFYRRYIPIRFVQFVDDPSQKLSDERIQYSISITNRIFFPARLRFILRANISVVGSEFTSLYLRDETGEHVKDANGHYIPVDYVWPENILESPLIQPLIGTTDQGFYYFPLPPERTERRYSAQMRAGTFFCPREEMLVYINRGPSNGGQYPWYSRIIGMSSYHMAHPDYVSNETVFAHEVGHYLGLPHTFPAHLRYSTDYDLARMINPPPEGDPPLTQRRYYETHENLIDVETGAEAPLSMFWDQVFAPVGSPGGICLKLFFDSREEAALWEEVLQPIEQWGNGSICRQDDGCCGAEAAKSVRLQIMVGAGCLGYYGFTENCECEAAPYCTGDPKLRAFSRPGSAPNRLFLNLMAYGYHMNDYSDVPEHTIEGRFLSQSQLEQIERVLIHDVETAKYFPGGWGHRPDLGSCTTCHMQ